MEAAGCSSSTASSSLSYSDFTTQTSTLNFCIFVEEKALWAPKDLLACHSPALEALVHGSFAEKESEVVTLPGKKYNDVLEFLRCIVPCPVQKSIDNENIDILLGFAKEYMMPDLMSKCEKFLQENLKNMPPLDPGLLGLLVIASTHDLKALAIDLIPKVANLNAGDIRKYYGIINPNILLCVQDFMLQKYAQGINGKHHGPRASDGVSENCRGTFSQCHIWKEISGSSQGEHRVCETRMLRCTSCQETKCCSCDKKIDDPVTVSDGMAAMVPPNYGVQRLGSLPVGHRTHHVKTCQYCKRDQSESFCCTCGPPIAEELL